MAETRQGFCLVGVVYVQVRTRGTQTWCEKINYSRDLTSQRSTCHTTTSSCSHVSFDFRNDNSLQSKYTCSYYLEIENSQPKMKSLSLLLIAISSVASFTPLVPTTGLPAIRQIHNERVFMSGQSTLEKESTELPDWEIEEGVPNEAVVDTEEEMTETQKLLKKVKEAGTAGVISYAAWELAFWAVSVPVCIAGYRSVTGHFPNFSNKEDLAQLGAEAFAFVNFARFAVPLRIGLALSTTQWVQKNVVDRFQKSGEDAKSESSL